jgi:flagellar basal-body rod protein FlgF
MENAGYIALSRQLAVSHSLDLIANNIANTSTVGFKGHRLLFDEYLQKNIDDQRNNFEMVNDYGQFMNTADGTLLSTGNTLDMAIRGEGLFKVSTPQGDRYSRNGEFQMNEIGEIVTDQGYPVLSDTGAPIAIPTGAKEVTVTKSGDVVSDGAILGRVGVFSFENLQDLVQVGNNLFTSEEQDNPVADAVVIQGALEQSNVNPITEITQMISLTRHYQSSQQIIIDEHERQRQAINKLGGQS